MYVQDILSNALGCRNKEGKVLLGCLELYYFELSWANISSIFLPGIEGADGAAASSSLPQWKQ